MAQATAPAPVVYVLECSCGKVIQPYVFFGYEPSLEDMHFSCMYCYRAWQLRPNPMRMVQIEPVVLRGETLY